MVRVAKLVDDINLKQKNKKYNPVEIIINSDNSNVSDCSDLEKTHIQLSVETSTKVRPIPILPQIRARNTDVFNKLYISCIKSK